MKTSKLFRKSSSERIVRVVAFTIMLIHCLAILYIFAYGLNASLRYNGRAFHQDVNALAIGKGEPNFKNFILAFDLLKDTDFSYFTMVINSIWYSIGGTLFSLAVSCCSTYVIARYKNKFTKTIFKIYIFSIIFPVIGSAPSLYRLFHQLGIDQTPLILLTGLNSICNLMLYAFFSSLSWTYAEAAFIDGANDFQVFLKVMLPMALPSISVLFVTGVIAMWNDYSTPLLYLNESFPTLASGLFTYEQLMSYNANEPVYFAGVVLAMIPPIILYATMSNTIMTKVYLGGLKG